MNSIGLNMNLFGKMSGTPAVSVCRLQAELVIVKNLAVCCANPQIFFYAAGTTQEQSPAPSRSVPAIFQTESGFNN